MDIGIITGVITMPDFKKEYGLDKLTKIQQSNLSANLVSVMQAGAFAGALLANPIADKIGRKAGLFTAAAFAFVGGLLQGLSFGKIACFYVGR